MSTTIGNNVTEKLKEYLILPNDKLVQIKHEKRTLKVSPQTFK